MHDNLRFVSPRDRVLFLRTLAILEGVEATGLMLIAEQMREVYFRPGDVLVRKGEPIDTAYALVEGRVGLVRDGEEIAHVVAPAPVGFLGVLGGIEGIPGDIVALSDITALKIGRESLVHVWEEDFDILYQSLRVASGRILAQRGGLPFDPEAPPSLDVGIYPEEALTLVDLIKLQRDFGPFRGANLEAVAEVCRQQEEIRLEPGEYLWREGDPGNFAIRIHYGQVRIEKEGRDEPLALGHDYTIGFTETLAQNQRTYSAITETRVVGIRVDIDPLLSVFEDHFDLAIAALQQLSRVAVESLWRREDFALLTR